MVCSSEESTSRVGRRPAPERTEHDRAKARNAEFARIARVRRTVPSIRSGLALTPVGG